MRGWGDKPAFPCLSRSTDPSPGGNIFRNEVDMAKRMMGNFKSEKRKKELARLKKQEEKRQRRQSAKSPSELGDEEGDTQDASEEESKVEAP